MQEEEISFSFEIHLEIMGSGMVDVKAGEPNDMPRRCCADESHETTAWIK